jgi:voltage-gated potassium channel
MDITIEQVRVSERSEMAGRSLKEMQVSRDIGVIVMAIRRGDGSMTFNPPAETAVHAGDFLIVMGQQENLRTLEALVAGSRATRR